eukprot:1985577-Amphidinium_carterae.1
MGLALPLVDEARDGHMLSTRDTQMGALLPFLSSRDTGSDRQLSVWCVLVEVPPQAMQHPAA